jgi:hypothetical protein
VGGQLLSSPPSFSPPTTNASSQTTTARRGSSHRRPGQIATIARLGSVRRPSRFWPPASRPDRRHPRRGSGRHRRSKSVRRGLDRRRPMWFRPPLSDGDEEAGREGGPRGGGCTAEWPGGLAGCGAAQRSFLLLIFLDI